MHMSESLLSSTGNPFPMSYYDFGGRPQSSINICCLISEMEGTYQHLKYMGFGEDMEVLAEMKKRYYKLYFKTKKEENNAR